MSSIFGPVVTSWTVVPFPVAPWDPPGLPPRTLSERCVYHRDCAYRDDDPTRCSRCHSSRCGVAVEKDAVGDDVVVVPAFSVGDVIRIERDETRHPSRGTWPQFRGRTGTVVDVNRDSTQPDKTEYGVVFGKVERRTDGRGKFIRSGNEPITWFKGHELVSWAGLQSHSDDLKKAAKVTGAQQDYGLVR